jgi:hypothetical protein
MRAASAAAGAIIRASAPDRLQQREEINLNYFKQMSALRLSQIKV